MTASATRRSTRERKKAATIYDDAKMKVRRVSPKPKPKADDKDSDEESNTSIVVVEEPNNDDNESTRSNCASPSSKSEAPQRRKKSPHKIHVQFKAKKNLSPRKTIKTTPKSKGGGPVKTRLIALKNKVLDPEETSENSLTAAILMACTSTKHKKSTDDDVDAVDPTVTQYPEAFQAMEYTSLLVPVARRVLQTYQNDPNRAHVDLLNFIFRSVGGSYATTLDANTSLEEMDDDQWEQVVTSIVDDMRHTPHDAILISSCPLGAVFAQDPAKHPTGSGAQEEYRRIFDHFWYLLGTLSLNSSSSSTGAAGSGASFDIEQVRDLACRMMELVTVGQPDLRSAASQGALMLALAACDGTLAFHARLTTAQRQLKAATAAKTITKQKALEQTVTALERSCADLEQVVTETIIPGVFMRRYRDSDPYIRAFCLDIMSQMSLRRPDLFLRDIYLKYNGWMMSDKHSVVRVAAIKGLLLPFTSADEQNNQTNIHPLQVIQLSNMEKVLGKFLPRLAECVVDVSVSVQEQAVKLLVSLMRHGFMDDVEDERVWNRINLRALAADATPGVRKDALYFVLEQLEAFDVPAKTPLSEQQKVFQIDSLAVWVAHALSDGRIPIERLRVHLTDYVVQSLRDMPEHSHLATDWPAMIQAIQNDTEANADSSHQRLTAAKQRVLLHMLATAAGLEFESSQLNEYDDKGTGVIDQGLIKVHSMLRPPIPVATLDKKKKKSSTGITKERLTVSLVKALPQLLEAFKGNIAVLRSLTNLPRFFVPSVITLPQRKNEVQALVTFLGDIFVESTDTTILQNTCLALTVLAKGDHARNQEAQMKLKAVASTIQGRLFQLYLQEKVLAEDDTTIGDSTVGSTRRRLSMTSNTRDTSTRDTEEETTVDGNDDGNYLDQQHAILLCLRRLRILSKRWYMGVLLARDTVGTQDESTTLGDSDPSIQLCIVVAKWMANELKNREVPQPEDDDSALKYPSIWSDVDSRIHRVVAAAIGEGLQLILAITAWRLRRALNREAILAKKASKDEQSDDSENEDDDDEADATATVAEVGVAATSIVRSREGLVKLLTLCFDMYVDSNPTCDPGKEHLAFANTVQMHAGRGACDLRTLFPKEWSDAKSQLLRSCALKDDSHLIGGFVRFFRANEEEFEDAASGKIFKEKLLLPLSRALCIGWEVGNRREAGLGLAHIVHPSEEVSKAASVLNRTLKKLDSVRLVESHMACLRSSYTDWMEREPEEPDDDRPSEENLVEFAAMEKAHREEFKILEQKAARLSNSLGVGKLSEPKLYPALFGFLKEGIRFAFSNEGEGSEDEFLLGSRLSFLVILLKYLVWLKKQKKMMKELCSIFEEKEEELRSDPDFDEIREEDMDAVEAFRKALGIFKGKPAKAKRALSKDSEEDGDTYMSGTPPASGKRRLSTTSSVRSGRSGASNLSPLYEAEGGSGSDEDDVPIETLKKQKRESPQAIQEAIKEASDEDEGSSGTFSTSSPIEKLTGNTPLTQS